MTVSRQTTGVLNGGIGVTSVATAAMNVSVGDVVVIIWGKANGRTATSVTDTAGNTYTSAGDDNSDGSVASELWYTIATSANASNVVTVAHAFGDSSLAWGQYRTDNGPFTYNTRAKVAPGFFVSPATTASFNTTRAGVVVAGCSDQSTETTAITNSGSLTIQSSQAGNATTRFGTALSDAIYTSGQTGLTAAIASASPGRLLVYAASFVEAAAAAALDETDWFICEPQGQPLTISVW